MIYARSSGRIKALRTQKTGFTIVELIVIIVVIGILAAITIVSYTAVTRNAKEQELVTNISQLAGDIKKYRFDKGSYPLSLDGFTVSDKYIYNYSPGNGAEFCLSLSADKVSRYVTSANTTPQAGSCGKMADGGFYHTIIVKDGTVYTWGRNANGQLGIGNTVDQTTPQAVSIPGYVIDVAAGYYFSMALTADGQVYAWGSGGNGQLGRGSSAQSNSPVAVDMSGAMAGKKVKAIAAGGFYGSALTTDGKVYTWGRGTSGELANGTQPASQLVPVEVTMTGALSGKTIVDIEAGYYHGIALASDGTVYTWGTNLNGELGTGSVTDDRSAVPVAVDMTGALAGKRVSSIDTGYYHNAVMTIGGEVYTWGRNQAGQLGLGSSSSTPFPSPVRVTAGSMAGVTASKVVAGGYLTGVVAPGGTQLIAWGNGSGGALGRGSTTSTSTPVPVTMTGALSGKTVAHFAFGDYHAVAIDTQGQVYGWGTNTYGQVGDGTTDNALVPTALTLP